MLHCETDKAEGGYIKTPGALFIAENGIKNKQRGSALPCAEYERTLL